MIVTPTPANLTLPGSPVPRSRGIHASGLIRSIAAHMGVLKAEWVDDPDYIGDSREITDPTAILRICIGLAWEEWYLKQLIKDGVMKHPGEMTVDNIHMTPDGVSTRTPHCMSGEPLGRVTLLHEVKATYKSIRTVGDFTNQWMWLAQGKGYCKGAKTRFVKYHVLHLCGDYKMPIKPIAQCWNVEFTQAEIDENWSLLTEYKDYQENR